MEAAKAELAEAGYPDGEGFPSVEITYANNDRDKKTSEAIQQMLEENLGTVSYTHLNGVKTGL